MVKSSLPTLPPSQKKKRERKNSTKEREFYKVISQRISESILNEVLVFIYHLVACSFFQQNQTNNL